MKKNRKESGGKLLGVLLALAMIVGLFPGMSLTAYAADDPYASLKYTTTVITFDGKPWYLIDYDATTVTLLSEGCVTASKFGTDSTYSGSTVETAVNNYYKNNISTAAKAALIGGMFLLTPEQANAIRDVNYLVLKCPRPSDAETNLWWLNGPGRYADTVQCADGDVSYVWTNGFNVDYTLGVRPALKLNLPSVIFESESKTFSLKPSHPHSFTSYTANSAAITAACTADGCTLPPSTAGGTDHVVTLTLSAADEVYTGSAYTGASLSDTTVWTWVGLTEPTIEYEGRGDTSYTKSGTAPTAAGTYTASITVVTNKTATADFTISPMALTIDTATATNRTYDKDSTAVTISAVTFKDSSGASVELTQGTDYTVTGTMTDANAGDGKSVNVTVTLKNANYSLATNNTTTTVNINKADAVPAAVTAGNRTYDGTEKPLVTVTGQASGGEMRYALGTVTEATQSYTTSIPSKTDAGTYYVWYRVAGDGNHFDSDPACVTAEIKKAEATVTAKEQTIKEGTGIGTGTDKAELSGQVSGHSLSAV
ncbi:MAG: YDG domain-containing protein, partial [Succiniclasticum sp.]|nr:YDG domain-containing protein [Succiniclasticum sp.]